MSFADRSPQLDTDILAVGIKTRTMLADSADNLGDSTVTRIFNSVRQVYVTIVVVVWPICSAAADLSCFGMLLWLCPHISDEAYFQFSAPCYCKGH